MVVENDDEDTVLNITDLKSYLWCLFLVSVALLVASLQQDFLSFLLSSKIKVLNLGKCFFPTKYKWFSLIRLLNQNINGRIPKET